MMPTSVSTRYVSPPNSGGSTNSSTHQSSNTPFSPPPLTRLTLTTSQSSSLLPTSSVPQSGLSRLMQDTKQMVIDKEEISHNPPETHSLSTPTTPPPSNPSSVDLKSSFLPRSISPLPSSAYHYSNSNEMDWKANANTMPSLMGMFVKESSSLENFRWQDANYCLFFFIRSIIKANFWTDYELFTIFPYLSTHSSSKSLANSFTKQHIRWRNCPNNGMSCLYENAFCGMCALSPRGMNNFIFLSFFLMQNKVAADDCSCLFFSFALLVQSLNSQEYIMTMHCAFPQK